MTRVPPAPPPWWTAADQAELDTLIHEYVRAAWKHNQACAQCRAPDTPCLPITDAWEAIEDWVRGRRLLSRAAYLRAAQKISELRNEAA